VHLVRDIRLAGDISEGVVGGAPKSPQVAKGQQKLMPDDESGEISLQEEGEIDFESKSFGAQASKFQTQPNKKKNKVIIVDEEEEKEFGAHTSINNHISIGSIQDQEHRLFMLT